MNNKNTILINMLITATVIGFVETGVVQFDKSQLYADQEETSLILKKGEEMVEIKPGEKITIHDQEVTYRSIDKINNLIYVARQNHMRMFRFDEVTAIGIISGTKTAEYGKKYFLGGGIMGALIGFSLKADGGSILIPMCAVIDGSIVGLAGLIVGSGKKVYKTVELGPENWKIANE